MALAAGTRLGPYEITASAGAGGMGEVYKARDTRLDRVVAIKVLSDLLSGTSELQERFEREARTISQLNHPNICTLYDVGHHDGIPYIVLEYLDGETLAQRLTKGALPVQDAMAIAVEICEALDRAHRQSIIHRDLKPANVMLMKGSGSSTHAKLLDFGLAKLAAPAGLSPSAVDLTAPVTVTTPLTTRGTIMGTFQYMAPEQLEGAEADVRTDVWGFGCVLYEMLTGRKAFEGKTQATLISAILTAQPATATSQFVAPPSIAHVVRTCLAKNPDERFQSVHDLLLQLRWIAGGGADASVVQTATAPRRTTGKWVAAVVAASALTGAAVWFARRPAPPRAEQTMRFTVEIPSNLPLSWYGTSNLALSPDGTRIVYGAFSTVSPGLHVRPIDRFETTPLGGGQGGAMPFFSPDGEWIGFFAGGKLLKVPAGGGAPTPICEAGLAGGAAWIDGSIIFVAGNEGPLMRVSANGGRPEPATKLDPGETAHRWPAAVTGQRAIVFAASSGGSWNDSRVVVQSLDTGARRIVAYGGTMPRYLPSGHIVFVRGASVFAIPFDASTLSPTGPARPVLDGVLSGDNDGRAQFAVSNTGSLVYVASAAAAEPKRTLVWVSRTGSEQPMGAPPRSYENPRISPDGRHVALTIREDDTDIWVLELARGTLSRLTFEKGEDETPIWTPDGSRITFSATRMGKPRQVISRPYDGSGTEQPLFTTNMHQHVSSWSRDGLLITEEGAPNWGIYTGLPEQKSRKTFLNDRFTEIGAVLSPDGRWLAYSSNESSRSEVYVQAFPGPGGKWQISTEGGGEPRWAPNGRELFYRNGNKMMVVPVQTTPTFQASLPRTLFEGQYARMGQANYDVTADGRFLMIKGDDAPLPQALRLVLNWAAELAAGR